MLKLIPLLLTIFMVGCFQGPDPTTDFKNIEKYVEEYEPEPISHPEPPTHYYLSDTALEVTESKVFVSRDKDFNIPIQLDGSFSSEIVWDLKVMPAIDGIRIEKGNDLNTWSVIGRASRLNLDPDISAFDVNLKFTPKEYLSDDAKNRIKYYDLDKDFISFLTVQFDGGQ